MVRDNVRSLGPSKQHIHVGPVSAGPKEVLWKQTRKKMMNLFLKTLIFVYCWHFTRIEKCFFYKMIFIDVMQLQKM